MEAKRQLVGSKYRETIGELANIVELGSYRTEFNRKESGSCFVTGSPIHGLKKDRVISVNSKDSKGNAVVERYTMTEVGFCRLGYMNEPLN